MIFDENLESKKNLNFRHCSSSSKKGNKQWLCVMRKWLRVLSMDNSFLTKKICSDVNISLNESPCLPLILR